MDLDLILLLTILGWALISSTEWGRKKLSWWFRLTFSIILVAIATINYFI